MGPGYGITKFSALSDDEFHRKYLPTVTDSEKIPKYGK